MGKIAQWVDPRKLPNITKITVEFNNGKRVSVEAGAEQLYKAEFLDWLGPEEPTLIFDLRLALSVADVGVDLESFHE